jgi:hypothetical protein
MYEKFMFYAVISLITMSVTTDFIFLFGKSLVTIIKRFCCRCCRCCCENEPTYDDPKKAKNKKRIYRFKNNEDNNDDDDDDSVYNDTRNNSGIDDDNYHDNDNYSDSIKKRTHSFNYTAVVSSFFFIHFYYISILEYI